jgi:ribosomal protein L11 methyltransferase
MDDATWLEISLVVDGELAEAVAEVLTRYIPNGVVIESTAVTANADDAEGRAVGPLRVFAYLRMDDTLEETRQRVEEGLYYLGRIRPLPAMQVRTVRETDWSEAWKTHYHPIRIGKKLVIVPAWLENPDADRLEIRMDPGMAFGTGTHPTTQLCLEFVEETIRSGDTVLDIGCGSGILGVAALKLGARLAIGVDIDPDSVRVSHENATLNGVSDKMQVSLGSVAEVLEGKLAIQRADLVLANILAPVLIKLLDEGLGLLVNSGGYLALSGIISEQSPEVEAALERHHLLLVENRRQGDWVALLAKNH